MLTLKPHKANQTKKLFLSTLLILLLSLLIAVQSCSAQTTQPLEDKATSFLRNVIQLDTTHYKITLTHNNTNSENSTSLIYKVEPDELFSFESHEMSFRFNNDTLTSFSLQPKSNSIVYTQPRLDRFNQTHGIMERYQAWLNDSQVGAMADLMDQVESERVVLYASGNLSLNIIQYSDVAQYGFSNYFNGAQYTGIQVSIGNSSGAVFFTDNRASGKIGDTTIGITRDQAIAFAQNYVNSDSFRAGYRNNGNDQLANVNITGVRSVTLKAMARIDDTWYPYYDVEFDINNKPAKEQGLGVSVGANSGEIWVANAYSTGTTTTLPYYNIFGAYAILVFFIVLLIAVVVVLLMSRRNKPKSKPEPELAPVG